jgi:hypothetical protein
VVVGVVASVSGFNRLSADNFGSAEVRGINKLILNEATMKEALRFWLVNQVFSATMTKNMDDIAVTSVNQSAIEEGFVVEFWPVEKPKHE